jgi:hypothetical protein
MFIFLALVLFHWHLRRWFTPLESLAGALLVIASITITFNGFYPTVTDFPELVGITICVGLLVRRRWFWMLVALSVATFNRETSIIVLPVALCFLYQGRKTLASTLAVGGAIVATWWLSYTAARFVAGAGSSWIQPPEGSTQGLGLGRELVGLFLEIWPRRAASILSLIHNPHPYNVNWSVFLLLNVFWLAPLLAWRSVPISFRRLYIGGLLGGFPLFLLVGVLNEASRHMIPLYPLVMPAGLYVFSRYVTPSANPTAGDTNG